MKRFAYIAMAVTSCTDHETPVNEVLGIAMDDSIDGAAVSMNVHPLKTKQREAVKSFMKGNDVFVAFPTGYAKSGMGIDIPCISHRSLTFPYKPDIPHSFSRLSPQTVFWR